MKIAEPKVAGEDRPEAPPEAAPRFITTAELQKLIPVSRRTLFEWRQKGILPSVQLASKVLYHWPSVQAALLRHQSGGPNGGLERKREAA